MTTLYRLSPKKRLLTNFFVLDIETGVRTKDKVYWGHVRKGEHIECEIRATPDVFVFAVLYGHNFTRVFHSLTELLAHLKEPQYKGVKIFAHNGGRFDYLVMYGGTPEGIFATDPNAILIGSKLICFTNGVCTFCDSLNIFQTSLRKIGKMSGKKKGHLPQITLWPDSQVINYCIRDCEILYDALFAVFEFAGDIKITQASLAMTYFRRFHQTMNIDHNENTRFFWGSYFGGRTEVFKMGKTHSSVIDRNSMYPAEMDKGVFPNPKFLKTIENVDTKQFTKNILPNYEGLCTATVVHGPTKYGYLPFKNSEGKLLFPVGRFSGCWNFPEIRYALAAGAIKFEKIDRVVYSEPMATPFKGFVQTLWELRFKTNLEFEQYRVKIFMNSLYGKFAQRINQESVYIADIEKQFDIIRDYQQKNLFLKLQMFSAERNDAFLIIKSTKAFSCAFSIPSFSSYITSYARVSLLKKLYEMEKNIPVYCDTDSIFYEIDTIDIPDEKHLGGWKREGKKIKGVWLPKIVTEIKGLKNYKYIKHLPKTGLQKEVHLIKGVPMGAKNIGPNQWQFSTLTRTKESLRSGKVPGLIDIRQKQITGIYDKREVMADGTTKPFIL